MDRWKDGTTEREARFPSFHRSSFPSLSQSAASAYASTGGHTHTRFRSPYAPSTRPTDGHTLCWRGPTARGAGRPREGGRGQATARPPSRVGGALGGRQVAPAWL